MNDAKSTGAAYLLWFFLGALGAHRFYLGRTGTAVCQLLLTVIGWATVVAGVGIVLLAALALWLFVDLFLIPGLVQAQKEKVRQGLTMNAMLAVGAARPDPQLQLPT